MKIGKLTSNLENLSTSQPVIKPENIIGINFMKTSAPILAGLSDTFVSNQAIIVKSRNLIE